MTHTKGPWHVYTSSNGNVMIYETALSTVHHTKNMVDPAPICSMRSDAREGHDLYANADLIAAAPDMIEALIKIRHLLDNYDGQSLGTFAAIADEVIAKAKGVV